MMGRLALTMTKGHRFSKAMPKIGRIQGNKCHCFKLLFFLMKYSVRTFCLGLPQLPIQNDSPNTGVLPSPWPWVHESRVSFLSCSCV